MSETEVGREVCKIVNASGKARIWRMNTGRRGRVQLGRKGQADYTGLLCGSGRRLEIEMKGERGVLSADQEQYRDEIERAGGVYLVMRSEEDAHAFLETV